MAIPDIVNQPSTSTPDLLPRPAWLCPCSPNALVGVRDVPTLCQPLRGCIPPHGVETRRWAPQYPAPNAPGLPTTNSVTIRPPPPPAAFLRWRCTSRCNTPSHRCSPTPVYGGEPPRVRTRRRTVTTRAGDIQPFVAPMLRSSRNISVLRHILPRRSAGYNRSWRQATYLLAGQQAADITQRPEKPNFRTPFRQNAKARSDRRQTYYGAI